SWDSRSLTRARTAINISRCSRASADGRVRLPMPRSIRACAMARWDIPARSAIFRPIPAAARRCSCSRFPNRAMPMRRISVFAAALMLAPFAAQAGTLRVCSEPNNLPFSNKAGQGFENKIADIVARDMGDRVEYTWALQNDRFITHTLDAHKCDVMMGVSVGMDSVETTQHYYASTYVFVSRKKDDLAVASLADPRLHKLKIGV